MSADQLENVEKKKCPQTVIEIDHEDSHLAVLLAYASGAEYIFLKRNLYDVSLEHYKKLESITELKQLHVINRARQLMFTFYSAIKTLPYKTTYLQNELSEEYFGVLQSIELPYQSTLFTYDEVYNVEQAPLSLLAVFNRLTEGALGLLHKLQEDVFPIELDLKTIFYLDYLETLTDVETQVHTYRDNKSKLDSNIYWFPVHAVDIPFNLRDYLITHFSVVKLNNKSQSENMELTSVYLEDIKESKVETEIITSVTDVKTVLYVDTENIELNELMRLVAHITAKDVQRNIELRLYSCADREDFVEGWSLIRLEQWGITVTRVSKPTLLETKSVVDFLIVMDIMRSLNTPHEHIILSSDSDFHVLVGEVAHLKVAYIPDRVSSKYIQYLADHDIESINISALNVDNGLYLEHIKDLIVQSILNHLVKLPLDTWKGLEKHINQLILPEILLGETSDEIEELIVTTYKEMIPDLQVDVFSGTVNYKDIKVTLGG